ncbi:MAG: hypothetical protein GY835_13595 [bacterium]|nr:hypothetical protein [bacterium]
MIFRNSRHITLMLILTLLPASTVIAGNANTLQDTRQVLGDFRTFDMALGDLDSDDDLDLIITSWFTGSRVMLNDGSGVITASNRNPDELKIIALTAGDVDNDNDPDVLIAKK